MALKILNTMALTLLAALVAVVPATLLGPFLPGVFNPHLQRLAFAAWLSGLICWFVARSVSRSEQQASSKASGPSAVVVTAGVLVIAAGIGVALHFFGDRLM